MELNNSKNITSVSFTKHKLVRPKMLVFHTLYYFGGAVMYAGLFSFWIKSKNSDVSGALTLGGVVIIIIALIWVSYFVRCPNCKTRVFTLKMMWNGKMPMGGRVKNCSECGFPEEKN